MYYTDESDSSFYDKFRTYKISKGDTLQNVALKLGIDVIKLRSYHNMHCKDADLIREDFKRYTKFLILAPEKSALTISDPEEKMPKKANLGKDNKLPFLPRGISRDYSAAYTFEVDGKIDTMEMAVRVKWIATDSKNYNLFEIRRSLNLFIDDNEPDRMYDELGAKIVAVLYPLKIVVDDTGKWIDIYNYDEIVSRWESKKSKIFEYYREDARVSQELIKLTQYSFTSSDKLFEMLSSDCFLRLFFNGIHTAYSADYLLNEKISFPIEKSVESIFEVEQKVTPNLNDQSLIEVEQKGDYMNLVDTIDFSGKLWNGKYNAKYCLNSNSYFIEKINLECFVEYDETIKISLNIEALKKEEMK